MAKALAQAHQHEPDGEGQRKVARRNKGSHRRRKAVLQLQRAHVHVRNQRAGIDPHRAIVGGTGVCDQGPPGLERGVPLSALRSGRN